MDALGAWIVFTVLLSPAIGMFILAAVSSGKVKVTLPKRKPKPEVDPWASWKAIKANLDASRAAEHKGWQEDFDRLVQASCAHSYPATHSDPTFYTCLKCKYVEPWDEPHEGCQCRYETVTTISSPFLEYNVIKRSLHCKWHGVDWPINQRTDRSNRPFNKNARSKSAPRWEDVWSVGGI